MTNKTSNKHNGSTIDKPRIVIEPRKGLSGLGLADLWQYRDLLYFLFWREVNGRYRQMALGPLWIILQPIIQMVVFSLVFGSFAKLPSEGVPYPVFTFVALLPWNFFARSTILATMSLVQQGNLLSKIYFPRLLIPISGVLLALFEFVTAFIVLVGIILFYRVKVTWLVLTLPFFLLLAGISGLGIGLWLAGISVKWRDITIIINHALDILRFLTPVAYSSSLVPAGFWSNLYNLNPMAIVVDGFRWALLGTKPLEGWIVASSSLAVILLTISGAFYFRYTERNIVDYL